MPTKTAARMPAGFALRNDPSLGSRRTAAALALACAGAACADELPKLVVDRDNVVVRESCTLVFAEPVRDIDGNGIVQVVNDGVTVDLGGGTLVSIADPARPEEFAGIGVAVTAKGVTVRNGSVRGFKVGVAASGCDGATFEKLDLSGNYAQRLRSTFWREEASDWLYPHRNDEGEWALNHGAGLSISNATGVTVREVTSHRTQNGILLSRVDDSRLYDNDCSFLSGWGIAMWRSSRNTVCRNSLDFCIRGYSHTVYNRGQDSAGLLMFEQCSDNIVALNSMTHCGDGVFGFAGREALGETPAPPSGTGAGADGRGEQDDWHRGRGSNRNAFVGNDLSFAAAHGLEMTFSFANRIEKNRFEGNAICGIWGGYSAETRIEDNDFVRNGDRILSGERGGINIEHGRANRIERNLFESNSAGVVLWDDADEGLRALPWAKANGVDCRDNIVSGNRFAGDGVAIELRKAQGTVLAGNSFDKVTEPLLELEPGAAGAPTAREDAARAAEPFAQSAEQIVAGLPGARKAVGMRPKLRGRWKILMEPYGPYDFGAPLLVRTNRATDKADFRTLGFDAGIAGIDVISRGPVRVLWGSKEDTVRLQCDEPNYIAPFDLMLRDGARKRWIYRDILAPVDWNFRIFALSGDPVAEPDGFARDAASAGALEFTGRSVDFEFGDGVPGVAIDEPKVRDSALPADGFGMTLRAKPVCLKGTYAMLVTSDDGVRVRFGGQTVVDRWSRRAPTTERHEFTLAEDGPVDIEIDWFELDGSATLRVWFENVRPDIPDVGQDGRSTRVR